MQNREAFNVPNDVDTVDDIEREEDEQAELILTKDGNAARYILGEAITEAGAYTVTVTDVCGNSASYDFVIKNKVNIAAIAVGSVLGVGAIGGGVVWFIKKKRSV